MEQKPKRRLIRKTPSSQPAAEIEDLPTPEGYCYGPDSYSTYVSPEFTDEELYKKYSPDYVMARDKRQLYGNFCAPVLYDFINDLQIEKVPEPPVSIVEPQITEPVETKSSFTIMPASKFRETQREHSKERDDRRDYGKDQRDYGKDRRDYGKDQRDYGKDRRDYGKDQRESRRDYRDDRDDRREDRRDYREDRESRRDYREDRESRRDYREDRESRRDCREDRESRRDNDYHRSRSGDYERTTRNYDSPNPHKGNTYSRREPSKSKMELDSELNKYTRTF